MKIITVHFIQPQGQFGTRHAAWRVSKLHGPCKCQCSELDNLLLIASTLNISNFNEISILQKLLV